MQLKRPLCVAVLLLCTGLFLVQLTGQKMAEALPKEKEQISLGGRLMQKEEKNGHLLLYLQQVQILYRCGRSGCFQYKQQKFK